MGVYCTLSSGLTTLSMKLFVDSLHKLDIPAGYSSWSAWTLIETLTVVDSIVRPIALVSYISVKLTWICYCERIISIISSVHAFITDMHSARLISFSCDFSCITVFEVSWHPYLVRIKKLIFILDSKACCLYGVICKFTRYKPFICLITLVFQILWPHASVKMALIVEMRIWWRTIVTLMLLLTLVWCVFLWSYCPRLYLQDSTLVLA